MAQSTTKKKPVAQVDRYGYHIHSALHDPPAQAGPGKQHLRQGAECMRCYPIITAFVFSYFHGSFTGNFWTVLGIEAAKKKKEVK